MSNIVVPELGESVVEARIAKWLKKPGDRVDVGEAVVELETEKIDLEVSAEKSGVIASIARQEGEDVKIGELLAVVDESGAAAPAASAESKPAAKAAAPAPNGSANGATADDLRATPTARRVAKDHDVNLGTVQGTGSSGRVMKQDVQAAIAPAPAPVSKPAPAPAPAPAAAVPAGNRGETRVRMTKRRETIARRLVEAQHNAAMLTTFNEVDMTAVMGLRERQKESFKKRYGMNLGIASFFVKASIAALKAFPQLNAEIQGNEIVYKPYHDIGMAVGAEGGLVVPVLRDADRMAFAEIEKAIRAYAQKASDGTLTLEDLAGGTFTITNGGVFGSLLSTPILNPPQVAILGLHKIQERAVAVNGQVVVRPMMYVALSYDHRIVDGREAVQFLVKIKEFIEDPGHLLLES
ncbi:MAG TPA: 2-oxoglutarate dehydrogenase complex dihydrolipoyllysine-residue succinyltransferase [Vicinamibacterales bacterium]|jgi:2-oxoglutarate dehydrogenase E2 component (dihydrolipoamide succinyltransferase)|nr:2-oxoglutarate dehydrogenase complex dihydrolipoyllysine-residue succinyltransferase [Vicinamibacterales bacterium]